MLPRARRESPTPPRTKEKEIHNLIRFSETPLFHSMTVTWSLRLCLRQHEALRSPARSFTRVRALTPGSAPHPQPAHKPTKDPS